MIHIICNMGARGLSVMYALSPQALGICIRQISCAHVTTIISTQNEMVIFMIQVATGFYKIKSQPQNQVLHMI